MNVEGASCSSSTAIFRELTNRTPSSKLSRKLADLSVTSAKTPASAGRHRVAAKTPSANNTSQTSKSLKTRSLTPSRNANYCGAVFAGDRYIPHRSNSQFELAHFLINQSQNSRSNSQNESALNGSNSVPNSPSKNDYQRSMRENLNSGVNVHSVSTGDMSEYRILAYQKGQAPQTFQGLQNQNHRVLYSAKAICASSVKKTIRHIPNTPESILDAPDIMDDYYLNVLDWSAQNVVGVALSGSVYLWHAINGNIEHLLELEGQGDYVSSLRWSHDGRFLAVGFSDGKIGIYDGTTCTLLRKMDSCVSRISSLSWNGSFLTSGSKTGSMVNHDTTIASHRLLTMNAHTQEVCGLSWSADGEYLASGGNDNLLLIWSRDQLHSGPLYTLTEHEAAVKAVAWCPWQSSILASGGGTSDRQIRFWNSNTGTCSAAIDAAGQVSGIIWNNEYREIVSSHGYPSNQLTLWKYASMKRVTELSGHTQRVLCMAGSPCGEYVMSAGADEALRLWHCFKVDANMKKEKLKAVRQQSKSCLAQIIR